MQSKYRLIFLLSLALLSTSYFASADLIESTCRNTPNSQICESSLRSDPRSPAADTEGLIRIMIDVVRSKFSDSLAYVNRMMKESPPPARARALRECVRRFKVVLNANVIVAESAVNLGDPKFGEGAMLDSAVEAHACERAFVGSGGDDVDGAGRDKSTLIERTRFLHGLSNVAASMIRILE
ncbi:hypothetical protein V2J09_005820 [Rumex salicifolius]